MAQPQVGVMIDTTGTEEKENKETAKEEIVTRNIQVPEENVTVFTCGDMIMDLQLLSGAMIQITKVPLDHEGLQVRYRPVRLIGSLGNVDRAEKLIKAVVVLDDAGGFALLHKDNNDSDDYRDNYGEDRDQEHDRAEYNSEYTQPPRSSRKRSRLSFSKRSRSVKRPCVTLPSKQPTVCNHITPQGPVYNPHLLCHHSSGYAASQGYVMPQPPGGYAASHAYGLPQPPPANNQSSGYATNLAYSMPQPPAYNQSSGYAYSMLQPLPYYPAGQAYGMPQPPPYNQPQPPIYNQSGGYATGVAYAMQQPPPYNQKQPPSEDGMPQPHPYN